MLFSFIISGSLSSVVDCISFNLSTHITCKPCLVLCTEHVHTNKQGTVLKVYLTPKIRGHLIFFMIFEKIIYLSVPAVHVGIGKLYYFGCKMVKH